MTRRAWAYIWTVLLAGVVLSASAILADPALSTSSVLTFVALTGLTLLTQFFEAEAPGRQSYYPHLVFLFAGMLLLPPFLFVLLVVIPHLAEWMRKRLAKSAMLRAWYIQPFNIATHLIAGIAARWVFISLTPDAATLTTPVSLLAVTVSALAYVFLNHLLIGLVLVLARGISLRESGVFEVANLGSDLIQLCLGYIVAILWQLSPWLILPALSPLVMIYRALTIPQLKQEAHTDAKTGLWNAGHFKQLFTTELERAVRFNRPLALVMTDLDLLRNINNTYGHLAGDAVLTGIGRIIRETIREYDIPARFGGEEFCIGLLEASPEEARAFAERLRQAIASAEFEVATSSAPIHATMSFGVACFPADATTFTDLIHQADVAVYQAKFRGRNCVVSAGDVPRSIKLESAPVADRLETTYPAAFATRPEPVTRQDAPPPPPAAGTPPANPAPAAPGQASAWLPWFVGGVIATGVVATVLGLAFGRPPDLAATALLVSLAVVAELFQVSMYGNNTVSVSVAIAFAAALIAGVPGVAAVSAGIALTHYLQTRPRLYMTAFNWATHVLAGFAPALVSRAQLVPQLVPLQVSDLPLLGVLALAAGLVYYGVETGLVAAANSLSQGLNLKIIWREQFRWLASHYLVLCIMGLFLAVAFQALGLPGVVVFALPAFMMHYAQKQYVERTEDSMRELRRMNQELTRANREVAGANQAIHRLNDELFLTLAKVIDARDPYAAGHAAKVADYATAIAAELGLPPERIEHIRQAALLHDIGKLSIPERILNKPASLSPEEYAMIKSHASLGAEFLETCQGLRHLAPFIEHHHEWWDGRGYPGELRGEHISVEARILAVCDAVEAMASDRPYHRAMLLDEIIAELRGCAGTQFDPTVVEVFIRLAKREGDRFVINSAREVARHQTACPRLRYSLPAVSTAVATP